jgi:hypothetical protein
VVAVFGVIMMGMTTPIMVSNFHSLYINAVVGEPNTIRKVRMGVEGKVAEGADYDQDQTSGSSDSGTPGHSPGLRAAESKQSMLSVRRKTRHAGSSEQLGSSAHSDSKKEKKLSPFAYNSQSFARKGLIALGTMSTAAGYIIKKQTSTVSPHDDDEPDVPKRRMPTPPIVVSIFLSSI